MPHRGCPPFSVVEDFEISITKIMAMACIGEIESSPRALDDGN
jgi:hypothetical protein